MSYPGSIVATASWRDYTAMCKPRVVLLMLLTAIVGMCLAAAGIPPLDTVIFSLTGIALVAGSAAVVNHVADAHIDRRMARTRRRPVAQGRIPPAHALVFSALLGVTGMTVLGFLVNPLTALLCLVSWFGYGVLYTLFLKYRTPQNIVIGGLFGAAPPLFGWTAVTGTISVEPLVLVFIIFVWTPPHFWALALARIDDYAQAGVPMLPIVCGETYTRWNVLAYTVILTVASVLPAVIGMAGALYLIAILALDAGFLYLAITLVRRRRHSEMRTFRYSIVYLGLLFLALFVDQHLWPLIPG